jgi:hypothetical protein
LFVVCHHVTTLIAFASSFNVSFCLYPSMWAVCYLRPQLTSNRLAVQLLTVVCVRCFRPSAVCCPLPAVRCLLPAACHSSAFWVGTHTNAALGLADTPLAAWLVKRAAGSAAVHTKLHWQLEVASVRFACCVLSNQVPVDACLLPWLV